MRIRVLLLPVLGLLVACAIAEVALRIGGVSTPSFGAPDPILGWRHRPSVSGWYTTEGRAFVRINSKGWRDRERVEAKPKDVFRIGILGDSYAEALQVPLEATFWSLLEENLSACGALEPRRVEVLNFGVSSYGTAQELLALRHHVWDYEPDLVVLAFLPRNDVQNNSRDLQGDDARPYFVVQDGSLVLDDSFRESEAYQRGVSTRSRMLRWLTDRVRLARQLRAVQFRLQAARLIAARSGRPRVSGGPVFAEPRTTEWVEAWRVTERIIMTMHREVLDRGRDFYLVTLTDPDQVNPDRRRREFFAESSQTDDPLYPEHRLREFSRVHGIKVLTLAEPFLDRVDRTGECLHGPATSDQCFGHWNEAGHQLPAAVLSSRICGDYSQRP